MKLVMTKEELEFREEELKRDRIIQSEKRRLISKVKHAAIKDGGRLMKMQLDFYIENKYAMTPSDYLNSGQVIYCFEDGIKEYEKDMEKARKLKLSTG